MDCYYCTDPARGIDEDGLPTCGADTCMLIVAPLPVAGECAYVGRLKITNIALFHNTLSKGLGRRRAYGYGLLSISEG